MAGALSLEELDGPPREVQRAGALAADPQRVRVPGHRVGRSPVVAAGLEGLDPPLEPPPRLVEADQPDVARHLRPPDQDLRVLGVSFRDELQGAAVVAGRPPLVEVPHPVAGQDEHAPGLLPELLDLRLEPRRDRQVERAAEVVREQLRHVRDAVPGQPLDPGGGRPVLPDPRGPRDLAVGDVADQRVPERVLRLPLDRGAPRLPDELLPGELVHGLADDRLVHAGHRGEGARPEHLPHDRRVLEEGLAVRGQRVQAGGDDGLDGFRDRDHRPLPDRPGAAVPGEGAMVDEHLGELLRVQRVPAGLLEQRALGLGREDRLIEDRGHEPRRLLVGEGGERDGGGVPLPPAPARVAIVELWSRGAEHEERYLGGAVEHLLEERDQPLVRPVEVLDHEDERTGLRHRLQEGAPRPERLPPVEALVAAEPDERAERAEEPAPVARVLDDPLDGLAQLPAGRLGVVGLQDPGLRLHDLADRPERDALPVGEAPALAPRHELRPVVHPPPELRDEPGLPHAGLAGDGHELERALPERPPVGLLEQRQVVLPADERRPGLLQVGPEPAPGAEDPPRGDRLGLALQADRLERLEVDRLPRRAVRPLAHHDRPHRGGRLEAGRGVHDVPGHDPLPGLGTGPQRDERLAGGDPRPDLEVEPVLPVELGELLDDPERGPDRALRIVLVRHRGPEHGHRGVAHELLQGPAPPVDLPAEQGVVGTEDGPHVLRVGPVGPRGEADQVHEEDRDDLPLLPGRRRLERRAARAAEPEALGVLLAAGGAGRHGRSLRRSRVPA